MERTELKNFELRGPIKSQIEGEAAHTAAWTRRFYGFTVHRVAATEEVPANFVFHKKK
jgi:hypothetical protein